jgi:hypothetical protein
MGTNKKRKELPGRISDGAVFGTPLSECCLCVPAAMAVGYDRLRFSAASRGEFRLWLPGNLMEECSHSG